MLIEPNDPRLQFIPLDQVEKTSGNFEVYVNAWWMVHPEKGIAFFGRTEKTRLSECAPQCNRDENLTRWLAEQLYPWAEVKQIPLVML